MPLKALNTGYSVIQNQVGVLFRIHSLSKNKTAAKMLYRVFQKHILKVCQIPSDTPCICFCIPEQIL